VSPSSVRAAMRGVAADGMIFGMTLADNIRYGRLNGRRTGVPRQRRRQARINNN